MNNLKLGLIVNPWAGVGGDVALKGSDGADTVAEALRRGAVPRSAERAARALGLLQGLPVSLLTWGGDMGESSARAAGFAPRVLGKTSGPSTAEDTRAAVAALLDAGIDLLVFAGGDGTARDILAVLGHKLPVLGIPAGVKMHSAVYANNPEDAGQLLRRLAEGGLVELVEAEVRDIDETAFRQGVVRARHYGSLLVPRSDGLLQQVKSGGHNTEALALADLAAFVAEQVRVDAESDWLMGSGTTVAAVMEELGLPNTLLGVDLVRAGAVVQADVGAADILALTGTRPLRAVVTLIGGQGHLFGRGNQQFSPAVIRRVGRDNFLVLASRQKLASLDGRPLQLDTGDVALDRQLAGWLPVITGYDQRVIYAVGHAGAGE